MFVLFNITVKLAVDLRLTTVCPKNVSLRTLTVKRLNNYGLSRLAVQAVKDRSSVDSG